MSETAISRRLKRAERSLEHVPRRNPVCQRCGRRPTYDPLDAWVVTERALNTLPLMYQRRWCTSCITVDETTQRRALLDRREQQRRARLALRSGGAPQSPSRPQPETPAQRVVDELLEPSRAVSISNRRFGIECEFVGDTSLVEANVRIAGELCQRMGYTHAVQANWKIVSDSSILGPGGELVSPILAGLPGMRRLERACRGLAAAQARTNNSTGLHVHHEIGEQGEIQIRVIGNTLRLYATHQPLIDAMLSPTRRANHFCRTRALHEVETVLREATAEYTRYRDTSWQRCLGNHTADRYVAVNTLALERYGTLEFRQHQGTTSFERISAWVRFGQALITLAGRVDEQEAARASTTHEDFFARLNLPEEDRQYWARRIRFYAREGQGTSRRSSRPAEERPEPIDQFAFVSVR